MTELRRIAVSTDTQASIITNPDGASIKRVAWAYGCARKDSDVEQLLLEILVAKIRKDHP